MPLSRCGEDSTSMLSFLLSCFACIRDPRPCVVICNPFLSMVCSLFLLDVRSRHSFILSCMSIHFDFPLPASSFKQALSLVLPSSGRLLDLSPYPATSLNCRYSSTQTQAQNSMYRSYTTASPTVFISYLKFAIKTCLSHTRRHTNEKGAREHEVVYVKNK